MNRRDFIKNTSVAGIGLATLPHFSFTNQQIFTTDELTGKANIQLYGKNINLRQEAYDAFLDMQNAAKKEGVHIKIVSSYRSYARQKAIWERKYNSFTQDGLSPQKAIEKIIEYSTIPGTSRHHWGTDIDITDGYVKTTGDLLVPEKFEEGAHFFKLKEWMDSYADIYGFHLVYTNHPKRKGFKYEPWHYSYAPLSKPMLTQYRDLNIMKLLKNEDFAGSKHFSTGFINTYIRENILDINPYLL
jgi:LAS superfamily LD-carboxypeptidase LdcB